MGAEEIRQKLLGKFREVTADRVEKISSALLELEKGGGDTQELARELHTLKGEARMMGFVGLSQVVHAAEDLLTKAMKDGGAARQGALDALLKASDAIPGFLDAPPEGGETAARLVAHLRGLLGNGAAAAAAPPAPVAGAPAPAATAEAKPSPARPEAPPPRTAEPRSSDNLEAAPRVGATIRVGVDTLDEIAALAGDLLVDGARSQVRAKELAALFSRWNRISERVLTIGEQLRGHGNGAAVFTDHFEQLEGDVSLLRSDAFRFVRRHVDAVNGEQSLFSLLAERVGSARLIPLSAIFAGFPRAARDLAREQGKEVDVVLRGGETGVDRAILLSLNDPLVHLMRNSVDHGIEAPEERVKKGKPRSGTLTIAARTDGDLLAVTVEDDGKGIDPAHVRTAAVSKGLLSETEASSLSSRGALELVFTPGFSTREDTSEVSGRGVGLDVVKRKMVALGGSVVAESQVGKGTKFTLRLPQSLALMKVLLFRIDDDVYGLPAIDVDGVGRVDPQSVMEIAGIRSLRHRGRLMPIVALGPLLSLNGGPRSNKPVVAFVVSGNEGAALAVDGFYGEREVAVKAPGAFLKGMKFVSGAAALEDGRVAILLNTADVLASARRLAHQYETRGHARRRLKILLVDDSAIARETEAAILRALGHEVLEAADGEEGWQKLEEGGVHLLLTDVQMPVLDGVALTRRVRAASKHHNLPIVILSSLSAPEERRRGVDAGADAYLVKGELDAEVLGDTIERLCGVGS